MINQKSLKLIIDYNPITGIVTWKKRVARCVHIGDVTGSPDKDGYLTISIKYKTYLLHRIIWMFVYGCYPADQIDHLNHIKHDNRLENLRSVSNDENSKNLSMLRRNKSGITGVCFRDKGSLWRILISVDKKQQEIGSAKTIFEAACIRKSAELKYGYHKNHGK